ncbi:MAG: hypothetical protein LC774_12995 [Acidobacteria bacterium]|nr:hypothetical protein [Acidobacteriota bacterium]
MPPPQTIDEKAEGILRRAVEALGGASYLNIKSVIGRGNYTPYGQGAPGDIIAFVDYLIYPDRERTDYKGQGVRSIQTNIGADKGWVYDGMTKTISDMKAEQFEDFRTSLRTSVDNLLRGEWRREGASLAYAGRREAGLARRNEAVRVTYPDGFTVDFEFGARDGLPAKVLYKRTIKTEDEKEAVVTEEDRIERYLTFGGVQVPFTIDHYRDGVQSSRIAYDSVEFNPAIPDTLFAKPANPKAIK